MGLEFSGEGFGEGARFGQGEGGGAAAGHEGGKGSVAAEELLVDSENWKFPKGRGLFKRFSAKSACVRRCCRRRLPKT